MFARKKGDENVFVQQALCIQYLLCHSLNVGMNELRFERANNEVRVRDARGK